MSNKDSNTEVTATAVVDATFIGTFEENQSVLPASYAAISTASPVPEVASIPTTTSNYVNNDNDDDLKAKYTSYDYSHDDSCVVHDAAVGVASIPQQPRSATNNTTTNKIPYNTPYTTPYDPIMERLIAEEATRRGRMLSEQEIQDIRRINHKAPAINNYEQQKVVAANQNALYQNYKEETGLTQTSATIPYEAVAVAATVVATAAPEYYPGGTYGKGGYEISDYETNTYETNDYKFTEYKSVYDS